MSRPFLALCQDIVGDLGIAGGTLGSVTGALNREQQNVCNWVARADLYIQALWTDWNFLWTEDTQAVALEGTSVVVPQPPAWMSRINRIDHENVWLRWGTSQAQRILYLPWGQFVTMYQSRAKTPNPSPVYFSVDPTGTIQLSSPVPVDTPVTLMYWGMGKRMTGNSDVSPIPAPFDTIIIERAKIIYAGRENAQEILTSATAEYDDQLDKMQAYCLPNNVAGRTSRNDATTTIPAYVE